jgi:type VI secretion system protein
VVRERGLFERLRRPDGQGARSIQQRTERVADSVLEHLRQLLNTRHGDSAAVPGYGIPALEAEHVSTSASMQREIEKSIREFEPRLHGVVVRMLPRDPDDPLRITFEINARLVTEHENVRVRFTSQKDARGGWKVSG